MKTTFLLLTAAATGCALFTTQQARALGPVDIEIAGKAGYGTNPSTEATLNGQSAFNELGAGLGGRAGVSVFGFYGGVNVVNYFGGSALLPCTAPAGSPAMCPPSSGHVLMYGGELGYGYKISIVTIRPQIGVGSAVLFGTPPSTSGLYLEPGVTGLVLFGDAHVVFVGVDANLALFPNRSSITPGGSSSSSVADAFTVHGQLGVKF